MEDDDWVKFAWPLWISRKGERQAFVLQRYQQAWRKIYGTNPLLNADGSPFSLVYDAQYTCRMSVPWLAAAMEDGPALNQMPGPGPAPPSPPSPPSPSAAPLSLPASPGPQAGPSASSAPSAPSPPSPAFDQSAIQTPLLSRPPSPLEPPTTTRIDETLESLLRKSSPEFHSVGHFTKINGGFFPGFAKYQAETAKPRLRVVFPLIPQYRIYQQNQMSTPYINCMELSPDDVEFITNVDSRCLYRADEQGHTEAGQIRCFCSSWVSPVHRIAESSPPHHPFHSARRGHRNAGAQ